MAGLIHKKYPKEYNFMRAAMFSVWDKSKGVHCESEYNKAGLSQRRFLFDSFWAAKVRIGDGVGMSGDVVLPGSAGEDEKLFTAFKSIWRDYINARPRDFAGNMEAA